MTIALLGGTGNVSKHIPDELVRAGHQVRMLTRRPVAASNGITPITGDALSVDAVATVLEGCDAVVNAVGRLKNKGGFYARVTSNLLDGMKRHGVERCLVLTSTAVRLETDEPSFVLASGEFLFSVVFPRMLEDKREELRLLRESSVSWTVLRLPLVRAGEGGEVSLHPTALKGISVATGAIARAVRAELERPQYVRQAPFVFESLFPKS